MTTPYAEKPVELAALLDARETRAARQKRLIAAYPGCTVASLTVNVPGPFKRTPVTDRLFAAGCAALLGALTAAGLSPTHLELARPDTGSEGRFAVPAKPEALKALTCALEERLPYGRLLDIDVLDEGGRPLSRPHLGLPERGCIVCGKPGASCSSRRLHPLSEVLAAFARIASKLPEEPL